MNNMADQGWISSDGTKRLKFFSKAKEILKFMHDIQIELHNKNEIEILNQASEVIIKLVNEKMEI